MTKATESVKRCLNQQIILLTKTCSEPTKPHKDMKVKPSTNNKTSRLAKRGSWAKAGLLLALTAGLITTGHVAQAQTEYAHQAVGNELAYLGVLTLNSGTGSDVANALNGITRVGTTTPTTLKTAISLAVSEFPGSPDLIIKWVALNDTLYAKDLPFLIASAAAGLTAAQPGFTGGPYLNVGAMSNVASAAASAIAANEPAGATLAADIGASVAAAIKATPSPSSNASAVAGAAVSTLTLSASNYGIVSGLSIKALVAADQAFYAQSITGAVGSAFLPTASLANREAFTLAALKNSPNTNLVAGVTQYVSTGVVAAAATGIADSDKIAFTRNITSQNAVAAYGIASGVAAAGIPSGYTPATFAGSITASGTLNGIVKTALTDINKEAMGAGVVASTGTTNAIPVFDTVKLNVGDTGPAAARIALAGQISGAIAGSPSTVAALASYTGTDSYINSNTSVTVTALVNKTNLAVAISKAVAANAASVTAGVGAILPETGINTNSALTTFTHSILTAVTTSIPYAKAVTDAVVSSVTGSAVVKSAWGVDLASKSSTPAAKAGIAASTSSGFSLTGSDLTGFVQSVANQITAATLTATTDANKALVAAAVINAGGNIDAVLSNSGTNALLLQLSNGAAAGTRGVYAAKLISNLVSPSAATLNSLALDISGSAGPTAQTLAGAVQIGAFIGNLAKTINTNAVAISTTSKTMAGVLGTDPTVLANFIGQAAGIAGVTGVSQVNIAAGTAATLKGNDINVEGLATAVGTSGAISTALAPKLIGAVASALTNSSNAATLAVGAYGGIGSKTAVIAANVAAAVAVGVGDDSQAGSIAAAISTTLAGTLATNTNKDGVAKAVAASVPGQAAGIAVAVEATVTTAPSTSSLPIERANVVAAVISGVAGTSTAALTPTQTTNITAAVDATVPSVGSTYIVSGSSKTITLTDLQNYTIKIAATAKAAQTTTNQVMTDRAAQINLITFSSNIIGLATTNVDKIAAGATQNYMTVNSGSTANSFVTLVEANLPKATSKQNLAAGASLVAPSESGVIAGNVSVTMTGSTADADKAGVATAILGNVAAKYPGQIYTVTSAVAANTSAGALALLANKVATKIGTLVPANSVGDYFGAVATAVINNGAALTAAQLQTIVYNVVKVKIATAADVIGAALAAVHTNQLAKYADFVTALENNANWGTLATAPGSNSWLVYVGKIQKMYEVTDGFRDGYDAGNVTNTETGVQPG
ncbi:MAG: hypothetical protein WCH43_04200 [Verrucomicrobiota bacterium]